MGYKGKSDKEYQREYYLKTQYAGQEYEREYKNDYYLKNRDIICLKYFESEKIILGIM